MSPEGFALEGRILTFRNVHAAIAAERSLKSLGLSPELIPVPREISSACGFCLFLPECGFKAGTGAKLHVGVEMCLEASWLSYSRDAGGGKAKERFYEREA